MEPRRSASRTCESTRIYRKVTIPCSPTAQTGRSRTTRSPAPSKKFALPDSKFFDLTVSNPTEAGVTADPEVVLGALANPDAMRYDPQPRGLLEARQAVCRYYRESHGILDLDPERLILTTSTSEAYSYVFRLLCNPGDEILVPKPSYPLFEFLADLSDVKLVPYPLIYDHGWQIDFDSLYKAATRATRVQ